MEIAKALILARARRQHRSRALRVANRPILFHNLEALRAAGVLEAAILAEPEATCEAIRHAVDDASELGLMVRFAPWRSRRASRARSPRRASSLATSRCSSSTATRCCARHAPPTSPVRPRAPRCARAAAAATAAARTPGARLPPQPPGGVDSRGASGGRGQPARRRSCLRRARARAGRRRLPSPATATSRRSWRAIAACSKGSVATADPRAFEGCSFQGPVDIHPTATDRALAAARARGHRPPRAVRDAYIGPYTSIGADTVIEGAEIEYSILLPEAQLRFVGARLESSVIGRGARVVRGFDLPGAIRVSIGDGAEVVLR